MGGECFSGGGDLGGGELGGGEKGEGGGRGIEFSAGGGISVC